MKNIINFSRWILESNKNNPNDDLIKFWTDMKIKFNKKVIGNQPLAATEFHYVERIPFFDCNNDGISEMIKYHKSLLNDDSVSKTSPKPIEDPEEFTEVITKLINQLESLKNGGKMFNLELNENADTPTQIGAFIQVHPNIIEDKYYKKLVFLIYRYNSDSDEIEVYGWRNESLWQPQFSKKVEIFDCKKPDTMKKSLEYLYQLLKIQLKPIVDDIVRYRINYEKSRYWPD